MALYSALSCSCIMFIATCDTHTHTTNCSICAWHISSLRHGRVKLWDMCCCRAHASQTNFCLARIIECHWIEISLRLKQKLGQWSTMACFSSQSTEKISNPPSVRGGHGYDLTWQIRKNDKMENILWNRSLAVSNWSMLTNMRKRAKLGGPRSMRKRNDGKGTEKNKR